MDWQASKSHHEQLDKSTILASDLFTKWDNNIVMKQREYEKAPSLPLKNLKVVQFDGYRVWATEVELVHYFLVNVVALERIVVDPE